MSISIIYIFTPFFRSCLNYAVELFEMSDIAQIIGKNL